MPETLRVFVLVRDGDADCESLGEGDGVAEHASITDNDGLKYLITHAGDQPSVAMHYTHYITLKERRNIAQTTCAIYACTAVTQKRAQNHSRSRKCSAQAT